MPGVTTKKSVCHELFKISGVGGSKLEGLGFASLTERAAEQAYFEQVRAAGRLPVTREQIDRAKEVNILDYILKHEPDNVKRIGNTYYLKDHDSLRISNGLWKWESRDIGGKNVVDYLIKVRGYNFVDAVRRLAGDVSPYIQITPKSNPPSKPKPKPPFALPPRHSDNNRVIAYLQSRGISKPLIQACIQSGSLYQSAKWHNCVFVGRDADGKARYASLRGTFGDFKCDADGSDKRFGFCLPPSNLKSDTVAVFESSIDTLSHQMLHPDFDGWRLSLGCTSPAALINFLERNNGVTSCIVCTDKDNAGDRAAVKISELANSLGITVTRLLPPVGKDWNEALLQTRGEVKELEDVRKDIRFIDSRYKELFRIKDGDSIKITRFDGEVFEKPCRFIDETHLTVGNDTYHICEFAELMERNGNSCEAVSGDKPILHIIAGKYGEKLQDWGIAMTDEAIKQRVGGDYTTELLYGANKNIVFGALLRGKDGIAVCGVGNDNKTPTSLHPYWAQKYKRELTPTERPAPVKPSLLGELEKAKQAAAEHNAQSGIHQRGITSEAR